MTTDLDGLRGALLRWYARVRRDLPWRRTTDPYAILVSEVMLQQTQVARVVPRYLEWIERWPTADALAAASAPRSWRRGWGSATTAARSRCTPRRPRSPATAGRPICARSRASVRTPRRPWARSRSAPRSPRSTRTPGAWPSGWATAHRRAAAARPRRRLESGGDGARRDGLHGASAALRRVPGGAVVRVGRPGGGGAARRAGARRVRALQHRPGHQEPAPLPGSRATCGGSGRPILARLRAGAVPQRLAGHDDAGARRLRRCDAAVHRRRLGPGPARRAAHLEHRADDRTDPGQLVPRADRRAGEPGRLLHVRPALPARCSTDSAPTRFVRTGPSCCRRHR